MSAALATTALVFLLTVPWGGRVIQQLLAKGIGKRIRVDGPSQHHVKQGTATMGGVYILAALIVAVAAQALGGWWDGIFPLGAMLVFGLLGAFDDLQGLADREGVGWLARNKFPAQWTAALVLALLIYWAASSGRSFASELQAVRTLGWWAVPLTMFIIVAAANTVNLSDGMDGLAAGTLVCAYGAYGFIALWSGKQGISLFCFAVIGALLAFLWYNVHPARVFMGDTGSQALGAGLAVVSILSGYWLLLPVIGVVFVAEAISDIVQVGYFKYTRIKYGEGRRILRMAPLHHHFEESGWPETQVTMRFWIVAAIAAALGVALTGLGLP